MRHWKILKRPISVMPPKSRRTARTCGAVNSMINMHRGGKSVSSLELVLRRSAANAKSLRFRRNLCKSMDVKTLRRSVLMRGRALPNVWTSRTRPAASPWKCRSSMPNSVICRALCKRCRMVHSSGTSRRSFRSPCFPPSLHSPFRPSCFPPPGRIGRRADHPAPV